MTIVRQKVRQASALLEELGIDMWTVFVWETAMIADPTLAMVAGHGVIWQSFFVYTHRGDSIAPVGNLDEENIKRSEYF